MALRRLVLSFAAAVLAACSSGGSGASSAELHGAGGAGAGIPGKPLTVMTRNLYVGGDLFLPFVSQDPLGAASTVWGDILASDVPGRMKAVATEVRLTGPDLVGLEEAYRFIVTPLGQTSPVLLDLDFLALLQGALESPGHRSCDGRDDDDVPGIGRWRLAAAQEHTVITIPFVDRGVQITMIDRDAILVGPGVKVVSTDGGNFAAEYATSLAGVIPVHLKRGWVEAQVERRGVPLTFVAAHLETKDFGPLQSLQMQELLGRFAAVEPLVLVGDFNSAPVDPPYAVGSTAVPTPYQMASQVLTDAWDAVGLGSGYTCCFPADLRPPGALVERVDLVWLNGPIAPLLTFRTGLFPLPWLDGRWPSDHAGVVAVLKVQKGEQADDDDEGQDDVAWWDRTRRGPKFVE